MDIEQKEKLNIQNKYNGSKKRKKEKEKPKKKRVKEIERSRLALTSTRGSELQRKAQPAGLFASWTTKNSWETPKHRLSIFYDGEEHVLKNQKTPKHIPAKAATNKEEYDAESDDYLEAMCVNKTNVCVPWKMIVWKQQNKTKPKKPQDVTKSAS